jgi:AcrR family transcriptional regulator
MGTANPPVRSRDAKATRERFMLAAIDEFSDHGLAGARIDRIADRAGANKRLIYAYFGSKDDLFEAALARALGSLTEAVGFDAENLPGYAAALYDHLIKEPKVLRLTTWRNLERAGAAEREMSSYARKIAAIKTAQKAGVVDASIPAADLLTLVISLATSWLSAPAALKQLGGASDALSPRRLSQHRKTLIEVVTRTVAPHRPSEPTPRA